MNNYQTYCDAYSKRTGKKFHWFLGSCCLEISKFNEKVSFSNFSSSTNIDDADIIVIGKKLSARDIEFLNSIEGISTKRIISFGICSTSGGIFESQGMLKTVNEITNFKGEISFVPGCPPRFENFTSVLEAEVSGEVK
ncbi:NADH ubiquinone oxidoreductase 20 Kd subunit [Bacteriovorax sp. Seq25_V]|uniref:NADH-quinone oxidoreductase subunit B family protein n=1 Tax=Bacteriovorax sp. Seq25_V TaxID=1201288 RepID=UPI00038A15D2|nr:NADH ubiquinone oxidoreductase 20 Kd subunit [Bacteriovorax sp. Seq25_V]EQC46103.1 NADH ubiquinone oxidoreductase, 20 Kd subunit [Bacteriovorax sp. Seq25_V]